MIDFLRKIIKPNYSSLNNIEIIKNNLIHNLNYLYSLQTQAEMFPVLKSNAYGHGLKEVCKILNETPVKMIAVDSFPEAQIAYKYFKGKVLIIGEMPLGAYKYCQLKRTEFVVYNEDKLKYLSRFSKKAHIHLFVNTGMNREGIDDLNLFLVDNKKYLDKVTVNGLCSHLAEADTDSSFNDFQEANFLKNLELLHEHKLYPKWIHLGNSAAVFKLKNKLFNAFRPGLALYGINNNINLKGALRLYSRVVAVHKVKPGDKVSYNNSFVAKKDSTIAVIAFGYFEGLDRRLSNCAKFLYRNNKESLWLKVAGNVSMNLTCLDCGNADIRVGEQVNLISEIKEMDNSVENLSKKIDIIPYEFLIRLNSNISRKIV